MDTVCFKATGLTFAVLSIISISNDNHHFEIWEQGRIPATKSDWARGNLSNNQIGFEGSSEEADSLQKNQMYFIWG